MTDTAQASLASTATTKPPFYRDATVVKWIAQLFALAVVIFAMVFLAGQAADNLQAKSINTGFGFLEIDPSFALGEGIDKAPNTGGRALWVGMVNTLRMSSAGILLATILGTVIGVARLSSNWMVHKLASAFIEYMRNIPLLVHIFLIFYAISIVLPRFGEEREPVFGDDGNPLLDDNGELVTEAIQGPWSGVFHVSNKGIQIPRLHFADGFYQWMIIVLIGMIAARFVVKRRQIQQDTTGTETYPLLTGVGVVAAFGVLGWFIHPIFNWLDKVLDPIGDTLANIPQVVVQFALSILAIGAATWWIKRFFDSRRTPAGLAKLTDDDWFRVIFAGVLAAIATLVFLVIWPGLSSWLINSVFRDLPHWLADKFGESRGNIWDDPPLSIGMPDVEQRGRFANMGPSGLNFTQGFAAVFIGVVLYTAAFIAEIVRGGIMAVPKGQTEAAQAIGLRRSTMLRRVILPQAFRVSLPPLGNQYLNLTKNTSLAIAVGYTDVVQVGQTLINQTGKALEVFILWMLFYLACSLTISVVVNFFNIRLQIVER